MNERYVKYVTRSDRLSKMTILQNTVLAHRFLLDSLMNVFGEIGRTHRSMDLPQYPRNAQHEDLKRIGSDMYNAIEQYHGETQSARIQSLQS